MTNTSRFTLSYIGQLLSNYVLFTRSNTGIQKEKSLHIRFNLQRRQRAKESGLESQEQEVNKESSSNSKKSCWNQNGITR